MGMMTCNRLIKNIFGDDYKTEFKELFNLAWPTILTTFAKTFNFTISVIMCGHLSRVELDTVALSNTTLNIFGMFVAIGLSTAMDTIFSKTFGRGKREKMFMLLIKFWILTSSTFFFLASIHIHMESILLLFGQNPLIAKLSSLYISHYLPGLFFDFSFLTFARYLQNQNIVFPPMIFAFCGNIFNAISQYIAIYVLNYSYLSSAICQAMSSCVMFSTQLLYIFFIRIYKNSDFNYNDILTEWGFFFKLGIPGIVMLGLEESCFEISTLAAGVMGIVQLGVHSIMVQVLNIAFMIPLGISIAVNIRIGQHLGAASPVKARNCFRLSLALVLTTATVMCTLISSLSSVLPLVFTEDEEIISQTSSILGILGFFQYVDGLSAVPGGAMRACERQLLGAIIVFIGLYVISMPITFVLAFVAKWQVTGLWIGLAIGVSLEAIAFMIIVLKTDWKRYAKIVSELEDVQEYPFIQEVNENSQTVVNTSNRDRLNHVSINENEQVYELVIDQQNPTSHSLFRSLLFRRVLAILILMILFSVSLIIRLVRPEYCIPPHSVDNSTDISHLSVIHFCNEEDTNN